MLCIYVCKDVHIVCKNIIAKNWDNLIFFWWIDYIIEAIFLLLNIKQTLKNESSPYTLAQEAICHIFWIKRPILMKNMNSTLLFCIKIVCAQINIWRMNSCTWRPMGEIYGSAIFWQHELSKAIGHQITFPLTCSRASPSFPPLSLLHHEFSLSMGPFPSMYDTALFFQSQNTKIKNKTKKLTLLLLWFSSTVICLRRATLLAISPISSPILFSPFSTQIPVPQTPSQMLLIWSPMTFSFG